MASDYLTSSDAQLSSYINFSDLAIPTHSCDAQRKKIRLILSVLASLSTTMTISTSLVGYLALSSGYEQHVVDAFQTVGINLAPEPVPCLYTFA